MSTAWNGRQNTKERTKIEMLMPKDCRMTITNGKNQLHPFFHMRQAISGTRILASPVFWNWLAFEHCCLNDPSVAA